MSRLFALALGLSVMGSNAMSACASDTWAYMLSPGPQTLKLIGILKTESGRDVSVFSVGTLEGSPFAGDVAKRIVYAVLARDETGSWCIEKAVSLGSYESSVGPQIDGQPRKFHLDYYAADIHSTLDWFEGLPERDSLDQVALQALN